MKMVKVFSQMPGFYLQCICFCLVEKIPVCHLTACFVFFVSCSLRLAMTALFCLFLFLAAFVSCSYHYASLLKHQTSVFYLRHEY